MTNKFLETKSGQSLIEIVVAVGIIVVVLVGVADLISRSLSLSSFQANKNMAINVAQNQLNYYHQKRDLEPTKFFTSPNPDSDYSICVDNPSPTKFECTIDYDSTGITNGTKMTVNILWNDGNNVVNTTLSQVLANPLK